MRARESAPRERWTGTDAPGEGAGDLRPFYAGFWFGGFNGLTWMIGLGTPMVLLAEKLGATALQVGLTSSFVFLLLPVQLFATTTLERLGFKRQMVVGWLVRALFLFVPLTLVWMAPAVPRPWMVTALLASLFGFCFFRAFGAVAHIPWFSTFLPVRLRGRFFATDHAITSVVGVATLLASAALFETFPGYGAFRILYGVAVAGALMAVWNLSRLPDVAPPRAFPLRSLAGEARQFCFRAGLFRHYLGLGLLGSLVVYSFAGFSVYYLKVEREVPASAIMVCIAVQFAGQILGTLCIRQLIDRLPIGRFFQLAYLLFAAVQLFWIGLVWDGMGSGPGLEFGLAGNWVLPLSLAGSYFVFGAAVGISNSTHFTYLPELSSEAKRPLAVAVYTSVQGLVAGLAPIAWGAILKRGGGELGINLPVFLIYFAVGLGLSLLLVVLFARLPDTRSGIQQARGSMSSRAAERSK